MPLSSKKQKTLDMVVHAFNPSIIEEEAGRSKFKATLVYRSSSRTVRATKRNLS